MPAYRALTQTTGTAAGLTGTDPSGAATDDIIVAVLYRETTVANTVTVPSGGWSDSFNGSTIAQDTLTVGQQFTTTAYWIRRGASAPDCAFTWTLSAFSELDIFAYSGALTTGDPWSFGISAERDNTVDRTYPDVSGTTLDANELLVWVTNNFVGAASSAPPSGFTERLDNSSGDVSAADATQAAAGATGTITGGAWTGTVVGAATTMLLGLRPSGAAPDAPLYVRPQFNVYRM